MSILSKKLLMGLCCLLPIGSSLSSPSSSSPANDKPIVLRCGESYNGLKFTENGKLTFNEIEFDVWAHGRRGDFSERYGACPNWDSISEWSEWQCMTLRILEASPHKNHTYVLHHDCDHGGIGGSIINFQKRKIVAPRVFPEGNLTDVNPAISSAIYWSPEEEIAVVPTSGEVQETLNVINLVTGSVVQKAVKNTDKSECEMQSLTKLVRWDSPHSFIYEIEISDLPESWAPKTCKTKTHGSEYSGTHYVRYDVKENHLVNYSAVNWEKIQTLIDSRADSLCYSLPVKCKDVIVDTTRTWLKEVLRQSVESMNARRKFEILFSNPGAIALDTERLALFEEALSDNDFTKELGNKLNSEFLTQKDAIFPMLNTEGIQAVASDVAMDIFIELAINSLAEYKESTGDETAAYWIRTVTKPSIDVITLSKGMSAGTMSLTAASIGAGAIWAENIYSFVLLGARLNTSKATGLDVESQLQMVAEENNSIIESLRSGETRGIIFKDVLPPQKLTDKQKHILEDQLLINNAYQVNLLRSQSNLSIELFGWNVAQGSQTLAAKLGIGVPVPVYSGQEHVESTPSIPPDVE